MQLNAEDRGNRKYILVQLPEEIDKKKNKTAYDFEKVILNLLKEMGYGDFIETPKSRDGGIDGIINEDKLGIEKNIYSSKTI